MVRVKGESPSRTVVPEDEGCPFGDKTLLLNVAVLNLSLIENFRLMYSPGCSSPSTAWDNTTPNPSIEQVCQQNKMQRKIRSATMIHHTMQPSSKGGSAMIWSGMRCWGDDIYRLHHECLWMFKILADKMTLSLQKLGRRGLFQHDNEAHCQNHVIVSK